jgi:hypothetical protein
MKTINKVVLIGSGAAALVALAMAVKKARDNKDAIVKTDTPTEDGGEVTPTPTPVSKVSYSDKVKTLQSLLSADGEQCGVDGDAGKQTNGMLDYWFCDYLCQYDKEKAYNAGYPNLNKLGKGKVSPSNVDFYIAAMQKGTSPRKKLLVYLDRQQKAKEQFAKLGIKI